MAPRILSFADHAATLAEMELETATLSAPIGEMITTDDGLMDLVEKVRIDVAFGQAEIPLLYQTLYKTIAGPFPGRTVDIDSNTLQANVVFLEKFEAGEVQFGVLQKGVPAAARLRTWAAGFEWTEDMEEWDSTWNFELVNQAFGRAYNYLLNHLHLGAIILYDHDANAVPSYPASNMTPASAVGATLAEKTRRTFMDAYQAGVADTPQRTPSVILASELDRFQIEEALLQPVLDASGNAVPNVPVSTIIYYDGAEVDMISDTVTYPGVTQGKCYYIFPQRKLIELVHHDLRIDADNRDISRLVQAQIVGRTRRGIYAALEESVEEVTLPV